MEISETLQSICILDQPKTLFTSVRLSVCPPVTVCFKHFPARKNNVIDLKFGNNIRSCFTQISTENGPDRVKDTPTVLRKVETPLILKAIKN